MLRFSAAAALTLLIASQASAAEWHGASATPYQGSAEQAAKAHLQASSDAMRLRGVKLTAKHALTSGRHQTVRFEQTHAGLPVLGGQAAVRVASDGRVSATVLDIARDLKVSTTPSFAESSARALAATKAGAPIAAVASSSLAVLPGATNAKLVWQVDVRNLRGGMRYLVDAHSGRMLHERSLAVHAQGRVYPISSVITPTTQDVELLDLVTSNPQLLNGWAGNLIVTNYVSGDAMNNNYVLEQTLQPNSGADFLFDPPVDPTDPTDGFAQVGVYYHLTRMRDFFTTTMGVDMTAANWKVVAVSNMQEGGQSMDNAFFSQAGIGAPWNAPNMIAIGQGATFDFAQDSDVFNHEFTHYMTHNAVNYNGGSFHINEWGRSQFSAAIDEGLSDYFACTVNDDGVLGEASLGLLPGGARDLTVATKTCPADMVGESHADGEIIGSFAWTLRTSYGAAIADELIWGATTLLTLGASFGDFGAAVLQTADDMVTAGDITAQQRSDIETELSARGIDICFPELPLTAPVTLGMNGFPPNRCTQLRDFGITRQTMFHYFVTPSADAIGVQLNVTLDAQQPTDLLWNVYARKGQHVDFVVDFPVVADNFDWAVEGITATEAQIVIDATTMPGFDAADTYHFVVTHANCSDASATLSFSDIEPEPMGTGGGGMGGASAQGGAAAAVPPANETDGSCDCRAAGSPNDGSAPAWALLALGAASAIRRRRA